MATKKISELEAITEADDSDVLAIVDVSEGKTNKITKNNLLIGSGHSIEMSLNQETYALTLTLKNAAGTELSRASIDLPNENSITGISYNNGKLTLTKQSGTTTEVDITGLINGLVTETDFETFTTELNQVLQELDETKADIDDVEELQNEIEENYKEITKLQEENEDLKKNQLTNTPTPAISHYLQDSADSRFRKFIPIGRSVQDGDPTPENLVPIKNTGDNVNIFNGNEVYTTTPANFDVSFENEVLSITHKTSYTTGTPRIDLGVLPKGTYVVSQEGTFNRIGLHRNGSYSAILSNNGDTFTCDGTESIEIVFGNDTLSYTKLKIEQGTKATPYSPYGCGNVNEKVSNKNLFTGLIKGISINATTGVETTDNNSATSDYIPIDFSNNLNWFLSGITNTIPSFVGAYNSNKEFLGRTSSAKVSSYSLSNSSFNNGTPQGTGNIAYIRLRQYYISGTGSIDDVDGLKIQLEQGQAGTDYVAHEEQTLSFPLAQGQKFYEGSYPDDDEKVHHKWGEVDLSTLNWIFRNTNEDGVSTFSAYLSDRKYGNDFNPLCDYLKFLGFKYVAQMYSLDEGFAFYYDSPSSVGTSIYINVKVSQLSELQTWLQEKHPKLLYPLAEETKQDFTEEQKTVWEEWKKARTYKNVTHISSEDETPANVEIEYVQDTKTYIDNKVTALTNAITSLGGNV